MLIIEASLASAEVSAGAVAKADQNKQEGFLLCQTMTMTYRWKGLKETSETEFRCKKEEIFDNVFSISSTLILFN